MEAVGFISDSMKITVDDAQAAAGTEFDSTVLDMAGFNAVLWVVKLGTSDSGNFAKGQEAATADMSGAQDLLGTKAAGQKILVVDVQRPAQRYVRCAVIRAGVNTTVDAVVALQYDASKLPITQAAAIALAQVFGPAEGAVN